MGVKTLTFHGIYVFGIQSGAHLPASRRTRTCSRTTVWLKSNSRRNETCRNEAEKRNIHASSREQCTLLSFLEVGGAALKL